MLLWCHGQYENWLRFPDSADKRASSERSIAGEKTYRESADQHDRVEYWGEDSGDRQ